VLASGTNHKLNRQLLQRDHVACVWGV